MPRPPQAKISRPPTSPGRSRSTPDARPARRTARAWWILGVAVLVAAGTVVVVLATNRAPAAPEPRALTAAEADLLAVARFRNYQAGTVAVSMVLPAATGDVRLVGDVDYRQRLGFVSMRTDNRTDAESAGLVQFTDSAVAFLAGPVSALPAVPPADGAWQVLASRVDGTRPLNTLFGLALGLGADRPDNSQLLRQQGALWLRSDQIDGTPVTVIGGPTAPGPTDDAAATAPVSTSASTGSAGDARTRYWIDGTGRLLRLEARIGTSTTFAVIDLTPTEAAAPSALPGLPGVEPTAATVASTAESPTG